MGTKHREKVFSVREIDGIKVLHRLCTGICGEIKPVKEFYKSKIGANGIKPQCKTCKKKEDRSYQRANSAEINANNLRWRTKNPEKYRECVASWQERDKKRKSGDTSVLFGKYSLRQQLSQTKAVN